MGQAEDPKHFLSPKTVGFDCWLRENADQISLYNLEEGRKQRGKKE
jgi:hypothetical protein